MQITLFRLKEAADLLGMSTDQLLLHVGDGSIEFVDFGRGRHRDVRFTSDQIDGFIKTRTRRNTPKTVPVVKAVRSATSAKGTKTATPSPVGTFADRFRAKQRGA